MTILSLDTAASIYPGLRLQMCASSPGNALLILLKLVPVHWKHSPRAHFCLAGSKFTPDTESFKIGDEPTAPVSQLSNHPHLQALGKSSYCVLTGKFLISVYIVFYVCGFIWYTCVGGIDRHTMAKDLWVSFLRNYLL